MPGRVPWLRPGVENKQTKRDNDHNTTITYRGLTTQVRETCRVEEKKTATYQVIIDRFR